MIINGMLVGLLENLRGDKKNPSLPILHIGDGSLSCIEISRNGWDILFTGFRSEYLEISYMFLLMTPSSS